VSGGQAILFIPAGISAQYVTFQAWPLPVRAVWLRMTGYSHCGMTGRGILVGLSPCLVPWDWYPVRCDSGPHHGLPPQAGSSSTLVSFLCTYIEQRVHYFVPYCTLSSEPATVALRRVFSYGQIFCLCLITEAFITSPLQPLNGKPRRTRPTGSAMIKKDHPSVSQPNSKHEEPRMEFFRRVVARGEGG